MNEDYSYVGVPSTTQEAVAKEDDDHPVSESSKTLTPSGPEAPAAPEPSPPTVEWKSLVTPIGTLIFAAVLAVGHHAFNAWAAKDRRPITQVVVPQHWVTRIGVGFSFGFKSAVGVTMAFVLLQCLWLSVARQPLTIQQIDTIYRIERQDQLYKTLPRALRFSPTIVVFAALTLLLPLSGVFAPGSLTVSTRNYTDISQCMVPTGNLSTPDTLDYASLYNVDVLGVWEGVTPRATELITQWFVAQRIPDLPQACGPNCFYNVSIPSFVLQCTPNPSSLPFGQEGFHPTYFPGFTVWNGTIDPNSRWGFYVAWASTSYTEKLARYNGTSGNGYCSLVQAQYDVKVQTKGGIQSVTTNIAHITSPIPDVRNPTTIGSDGPGPDGAKGMLNFWNQLTSISHATQALFLGNATFIHSSSGSVLEDTRQAGQPSFLEIPFGHGDIMTYIWRDVLKGIEEMSHNVTASLLTLQLGTMSANCSIDQLNVQFYQYSSRDLWAPYGTALGVALISLIVATMIMARNNTGAITTSFSDTAILMRNMDEEVSAGAKLRLKAAEDGKLEYILE